MTWASTAVVADDDDEDDDDEPDETSHEQPSEQPALESNGGGGVEEQKEGEPGGQQERGNSSGTTTTSSSRGEAAVSTDRGDRSDGSDDTAGKSAKEEEHAGRGFSFATELFFLTHRALQVIVSSLERRRGEMRRVLDSSALQRCGQSLSGGEGGNDETVAAAGGAAGVALRVYKEADAAMGQGWVLEGFGSDAVTGLACQLANFTKSWLGLYVGGGGGGGGGASSPLFPSSLPLVASGFSKVAPALIETMCGAWVRAASIGREDKFLSRMAAEEAAVFCGEVMERVSSKLGLAGKACFVRLRVDRNIYCAAVCRARRFVFLRRFLSCCFVFFGGGFLARGGTSTHKKDWDRGIKPCIATTTRTYAPTLQPGCVLVCVQVDLGLSPVTQAKLVEVLEMLVQTGTTALEGRKNQRGTGTATRHGGFRGSLYWGARRGYAGAIMDSGKLRRSLPRQLMSLYASVQAIEGLGAEHYLGYFKFRCVCDLCDSIA